MFSKVSGIVGTTSAKTCCNTVSALVMITADGRGTDAEVSSLKFIVWFWCKYSR